MVSIGTKVPNLEITVVEDDTITLTTLYERLEEGPIVLAFFPAAFTSTCMDELTSFRDRYPAGISGHTLFGVSVDSPFVLQEIKSQNSLPYPLISDFNRSLIDTFDISIDFADIGLEGLAQRAVFAIDTDGEITYRWVADTPGELPPFDMLEAELTDG